MEETTAAIFEFPKSPPEPVKAASRTRRKPAAKPQADAAPVESASAEPNAITRRQTPKAKPASVPTDTAAPEIPDVIKRTQTPRRKPATPSLSDQLRAFVAKSPEIVEVIDGTADAPQTVEMTQEIGNYSSSLVLSVSNGVIFGSLDIWHKVNRKAENVYYETRAASVDEILVWLEGRYDEWRSRVNTPKHQRKVANDANSQPQ